MCCASWRELEDGNAGVVAGSMSCGWKHWQDRDRGRGRSVGRAYVVRRLCEPRRGHLEVEWLGLVVRAMYAWVGDRRLRLRFLRFIE